MGDEQNEEETDAEPVPYAKRAAKESDDGAVEVVEAVIETGVDAATGGSGVGGALTKFTRWATGQGEFSYDAKMAPTYLRFIFEDLQTVKAMKANIDRIREELDERKWPTAEEIVALIEALNDAGGTSTNYQKRKLLRRAAVNAFDPEFYEEGLVRRYLKAVEELEYGDVAYLRKLGKHKRDAMGRVQIDHGDYGTEHIGSLENYHLAKLRQVGAIEESPHKIFVTVFGVRLLKFLSEPTPDEENGR